jgi:hypothetical protein
MTMTASTVELPTFLTVGDSCGSLWKTSDQMSAMTETGSVLLLRLDSCARQFVLRQLSRLVSQLSHTLCKSRWREIAFVRGHLAEASMRPALCCADLVIFLRSCYIVLHNLVLGQSMLGESNIRECVEEKLASEVR